MDKYIVVYDFLSFDIFPKILSFFFPLIFYFISTYVLKKTEQGIEVFGRLHDGEMEYAILKLMQYLGIFSFCALIISYSYKYYNSYQIFHSKELIIIEGKITDFKEPYEDGKKSERFNLKGFHFDYLSGLIQDWGYNSEGNIKSDDYLKVYFYQKEDKNVILKLEKKKK